MGQLFRLVLPSSPLRECPTIPRSKYDGSAGDVEEGAQLYGPVTNQAAFGKTVAHSNTLSAPDQIASLGPKLVAYKPCAAGHLARHFQAAEAFPRCLVSSGHSAIAGHAPAQALVAISLHLPASGLRAPDLRTDREETGRKNQVTKTRSVPRMAKRERRKCVGRVF